MGPDYPNDLSYFNDSRASPRGLGATQMVQGLSPHKSGGYTQSSDVYLKVPKATPGSMATLRT